MFLMFLDILLSHLLPVRDETSGQMLPVCGLVIQNPFEFFPKILIQTVWALSYIGGTKILTESLTL